MGVTKWANREDYYSRRLPEAVQKKGATVREEGKDVSIRPGSKWSGTEKGKKNPSYSGIKRDVVRRENGENRDLFQRAWFPGWRKGFKLRETGTSSVGKKKHRPEKKLERRKNGVALNEQRV